MIQHAHLWALQRVVTISIKEDWFFNPYLIPITVNVSLSCELFMKSILKYEKVKRAKRARKSSSVEEDFKRHDLSKLFKKISKGLQIVIKNKTETDDSFKMDIGMICDDSFENISSEMLKVL